MVRDHSDDLGTTGRVSASGDRCALFFRCGSRLGDRDPGRSLFTSNHTLFGITRTKRS